MSIPYFVLNEAREYANKKGEEVVIYKEPSLDVGYDFMRSEKYNKNDHSLEDVLYKISPFNKK